LAGILKILRKTGENSANFCKTWSRNSQQKDFEKWPNIYILYKCRCSNLPDSRWRCGRLSRRLRNPRSQATDCWWFDRTWRRQDSHRVSHHRWTYMLDTGDHRPDRQTQHSLNKVCRLLHPTIYSFLLVRLPTIGRRTFLVAGARTWNDLAVDVTSAASQHRLCSPSEND